LFLAHDLSGVSKGHETSARIITDRVEPFKVRHGRRDRPASSSAASSTGQIQECRRLIFTAPSSSRRAADPIKIGTAAPLSGPFAESGRYQTQGGETRGRRDQWGGPLYRSWQCIGPEPLCRSIASARQSARQSCGRSTMSAEVLKSPRGAVRSLAHAFRRPRARSTAFLHGVLGWCPRHCREQ
jgi:hypothetical protein